MDDLNGVCVLSDEFLSSVGAAADVISLAAGLAPVCHVGKVLEERLLIVGQSSRLFGRRQHGFLRGELLVKVGHIFHAVLQSDFDCIYP